MVCKKNAIKLIPSLSGPKGSLVSPKKVVKHGQTGKNYYKPLKFNIYYNIKFDCNFGWERSTDLNNHLKMIARPTLCQTEQGPGSLSPSVIGIATTPFPELAIASENLESLDFN